MTSVKHLHLSSWLLVVGKSCTRSQGSTEVPELCMLAFGFLSLGEDDQKPSEWLQSPVPPSISEPYPKKEAFLLVVVMWSPLKCFPGAGRIQPEEQLSQTAKLPWGLEPRKSAEQDSRSHNSPLCVSASEVTTTISLLGFHPSGSRKIRKKKYISNEDMLEEN